MPGPVTVSSILSSLAVLVSTAVLGEYLPILIIIIIIMGEVWGSLCNFPYPILIAEAQRRRPSPFHVIGWGNK